MLGKTLVSIEGRIQIHLGCNERKAATGQVHEVLCIVRSISEVVHNIGSR